MYLLLDLHFGRGANVGLGLGNGFGFGFGAIVDTPGIGANVVPWPVIWPLVGTKLHTGLKQQGFAASFIIRHSAGRLPYLGHLEERFYSSINFLKFNFTLNLFKLNVPV